ncbi:MAG: phosphate transport system regulatory protein PhoU [Rickettsiales bacterium]|nr:phosphate transport system regulatory protein PhoU [Rickettsiales bacterium]
MDKHIVSNYDNDLYNLKNMLIEMGVFLEKQVFLAVELIKVSNDEIGQEIVQTEKKINLDEKKIREYATNTLSKRQPLADDLRKILISIKLASTLERMGDHACNIATRIALAKTVPPSYTTDSVYRIGQAVIKIVSQALTSYDQSSEILATGIKNEDKKVDLLYETCFREHLILMLEEPSQIGYCTQMLFIAKELERIGDLSKNISKEVIYSINGKLI